MYPFGSPLATFLIQLSGSLKSSAEYPLSSKNSLGGLVPCSRISKRACTLCFGILCPFLRLEIILRTSGTLIRVLHSSTFWVPCCRSRISLVRTNNCSIWSAHTGVRLYLGATGQYIKGRSHVDLISGAPCPILKGSFRIVLPMDGEKPPPQCHRTRCGSSPPRPWTWYQFVAGPSLISSSNRATIPFRGRSAESRYHRFEQFPLDVGHHSSQSPPGGVAGPMADLWSDTDSCSFGFTKTSCLPDRDDWTQPD